MSNISYIFFPLKKGSLVFEVAKISYFFLAFIITRYPYYGRNIDKSCAIAVNLNITKQCHICNTWSIVLRLLYTSYVT